MTQLTDLLNDFAEEIQEKTPMLQQRLTQEEKTELIDEYALKVKELLERIIG